MSAENGRHDDANSYGTRRQIAVLCGVARPGNAGKRATACSDCELHCVTADEATLLSTETTTTTTTTLLT